jgi:UDP-N-acetylmuramate: L-alanyl-gamma-D-glutamyl-meso-diaminopimelate ligase
VILAGLARPDRYSDEIAMNPQEMVDTLRGQGKRADYIPRVEDIVSQLGGTLKGGEVVLIMSNGGFGGIHQKRLDALA